MNKWKNEDIEKLKKHYPEKGKKWCCDNINKTEVQVRYMASKLGLRQNMNSEFFKEWQLRAKKTKIGKKRPIQSAIMKKKYLEGESNVGIHSNQSGEDISNRVKKWYKDNEHPRGMLGKKHTKESMEKTAEGIRKMWKDKNHRVNSKEYRQMLSDRATNHATFRKPESMYSRAKNGKYDINGKIICFRSLWEPNYALYLDYLIKNKQIVSWEYEPDTFWFLKIMRGVRSYKPDFKVLKNDGNIEYHEVKGWMDPKSKTKLKRMAKYYPEIKMVLIDKPVYEDIKNKVGKMLKFY